MVTLVRPVIRLFGEPLLVGKDGERVAFRTTKTLALLAYLVAREGRPTPRTEIAEALWPGRDPALAHQNLRQTLVYLRGCLGTEGEEALLTSRRDVRLCPGFAECDVETFRAALAEGPEGQERAIGLHAGSFMAGFDDDWLLPVRAELSHGYVRALLDLSDACLEDDPARALDYAERAIAVEAFHDGARTRKIRALRGLGEETLALREFEGYEALLLEELGLRPAKTVEEALEDRVPAPKEARRPEPPLSPGLDDALRVLSEGERPQNALALAVSLTPYWVEAGTPAEGLARLDAARALCSPEGPFALEVGFAAAELAFRSGRFERALEELEAVEGLLRTPEDTLRALALRGRVHIRRREFGVVRRLALHAIRFARLHGLPSGDGWFLITYAHQNDGRPARARLTGLRAQMESKGSHRLQGLAGIQVAYACATLGREDEAREALTAALLSMEGDRSATVATARMSAAWHFDAFGELERAEQGYREAVEEFRRRGDPWLLAVALTYLGDLKTRRGEPRLAIRLHDEALRLRQGSGDAIGEATSRRGIGMAQLAAGDAESARRELREAIRRYADLDWDPGVASCLFALAQAEATAGAFGVARRLAERAVRLLRGMTPETRYSISPEGRRLLPEAEALLSDLSGG